MAALREAGRADRGALRRTPAQGDGRGRAARGRTLEHLSPTVSWTAGHSLHAAGDTLAYYSTPSNSTVLTWFDANGVATGTLNVPRGYWDAIAISPEGWRAVMVKSVSPSESSLWLVDLVRGAVSPLSTEPGRNDAPVWSRDGKRVVWGIGSDWRAGVRRQECGRRRAGASAVQLAGAVQESIELVA